MIENKYLSINNIWNNLPWKQIRLKILILQKKIFYYSKECNKNSVYKIQNILLNSYEAKLLSLNYIQYILKYSYDYNNKKFQYIENKNIFIYLKSIIKSCSKNKLKWIYQQIKQYLLYLCIFPEWQARFDYDFHFMKLYTTKFFELKYIDKDIINNKYYDLKFIKKKR